MHCAISARQQVEESLSKEHSLDLKKGHLHTETWYSIRSLCMCAIACMFARRLNDKWNMRKC